ncbi:MAG: branched-chain amino acid ABC transporter permease [Clostridia bacterium]|nr:branched-chain amino acid ABC transporter permease [Clostridia bacterium]
MKPATFVITLINGLQLGSVYALIALGYTMVYGIVKLINFAHGDILMVGSYVVLFVMTSVFTTTSLLAKVIAVAAAIVFCIVLGVLIDRVAYKPLRDAPRISALITAIGVSLALQILAQLVFGSEQIKFPAIIMNETLFKIGKKPVKSLPLITCAVSVLLMIALTLFVNKTKPGRAMRAVSEDMGAARLMGINVNNTISLTFAIGCALAAIGSVFYAQKVGFVKPLLGSLPGIKAFIAAVCGGIGSIPGAVLGGFIIGVLETFINYFASEYVDAVVFGLLIVVLLVRPAGILGKAVREKV